MNIISERLSESIDLKQQILNDEILHELIKSVIEQILECFKNGGSVYFCGNGGSAADAQHLAAELSSKFYLDRKPLSAEALHCNTSFMTAVANDYSYDEVFARSIESIGKKGDILIGLTTSGNSKNVLNAFERCKILDIKTIAFTGASGGKVKEIADTVLCVPSDDTPRIQEAHMTLGHIICEVVENQIFGNK